MQLDPEKMAATAIYKLLIGCVVPRPIAWVSTVDPDGVNSRPLQLLHGRVRRSPDHRLLVGPP